MTQGPRDIFHGLSCLLAAPSGRHSRSLALLQGKMAASSVPFQSVPRFIEKVDNSMTNPLTDQVNPANSPLETDCMNTTERSPTVATPYPTHDALRLAPKRSKTAEAADGLTLMPESSEYHLRRSLLDCWIHSSIQIYLS